MADVRLNHVDELQLEDAPEVPARIEAFTERHRDSGAARLGGDRSDELGRLGRDGLLDPRRRGLCGDLDQSDRLVAAGAPVVIDEDVDVVTDRLAQCREAPLRTT